jgi:hypothetical protein
MAVPKNNLKELHNISLLHPVAVAAGCTLEHVNHDFNKIDVALVGCNWETTPQLNAQLKATSSNFEINQTSQTIKYPLDARTYNKLTGNNYIPTILILAIIPQDQNQRVIEQGDDIILKGSLYWVYVQVKVKTENTSTVTIDIPLKNKLSIDAIKKLMDRLDEHGPIGLSL